MAESPETGVFLEKRGYRRRRLIDGLKLLPFLGAWLFLLPVFWPGDGPDAPQAMSSALFYIFGIWFLLILVCAVLVRTIRRSDPRDGTSGPDDAGGGPGAGQAGAP